MSAPTDLGARLRSIERGAWIAGLAGLAAGVVAAFVQPASFFPGYLYAYLFWSGLSLARSRCSWSTTRWAGRGAT